MHKQKGRRRYEVEGLLLQGLSEKEVGTRLGLSPHTVHVHVKRLYRERGVESRPELMASEIRRLRYAVACLSLWMAAEAGRAQRPN